MKVLILPSLCVPESGSAIMIARNLAALFHMEGYETAVCSDQKSRFTDTSFYITPAPSSLRRIRFRLGTTIEEYMDGHGAFSTGWLMKDYQYILDAIHDFKPDVIFEIERPSAIPAGRACRLPVFSVVSPGAFRNREFNPDKLNGFNEFLSRIDQEQVLRYQVLYQNTVCLSFGPKEFLSFPPAYKVLRYGMSCIAPLPYEPEEKLSIVFSESSISSRKRRQIIEDAFLGAPYEIYVLAKGMKQGKKENLHYQNPSRYITIAGSRMCIHDGTDAVTQYCNALGVPQLIIHDDTWQRSWNGACLRRSGAGLTLEESSLTMERLYETYRIIVSDDSFQTNARRLREEALLAGDLSVVTGFLKK